MVLHVKCNNCTCDDSVLTCSDDECSTDCKWSQWSDWTDCTKPCGSGITERTRTIVQSATNGGKSCEGESNVERDFCNMEECKEECEWSTWSEWSNCSVPCEGGIRRRSRTPSTEDCEGCTTEEELCNTMSCHNKTCSEENMEWVEDCSSRYTCPLTCEHLADAQSCVESDSCEPGCYCMEGMVMNEAGNCVEPAECSCKVGDNMYLPGAVIVSADECQECNCTEGKMICEDKDCDVDCDYTEWSDWSECTLTCGGGIKRRSRLGDSPPKKGDGTECEKDLQETEPCNAEPCPLCTDPTTGETYEIGETIEESLCYTVYCDDTLEIVNKTIDNPACYMTTTTPSEPDACALYQRSEVVSIRNENGTICRSRDPVPFTTCKGTCDSFADSAVIFADNENLGVHSFQCNCCSGTTKVKDVDVFCGLEQRTVHIMEYTECGCNTCSAGADEELPVVEESESCPRELGYDSFVDNTFTVNAASSVTGYEPEKALKGSGSIYLINDIAPGKEATFAYDAISELMKVEGVTFGAVGASKVTVQLFGADKSTIIDSQVRDVDADGEQFGFTFDPTQGEVGRVKLLVEQSADADAIQLKEFAVYDDGCVQV
jgi:hypothetical protein